MNLLYVVSLWGMDIYLQELSLMLNFQQDSSTDTDVSTDLLKEEVLFLGLSL